MKALVAVVIVLVCGGVAFADDYPSSASVRLDLGEGPTLFTLTQVSSPGGPTDYEYSSLDQNVEVSVYATSPGAFNFTAYDDEPAAGDGVYLYSDSVAVPLSPEDFSSLGDALRSVPITSYDLTTGVLTDGAGEGVISAVPEPAVGGTVAVASLFLLARWRRVSR